MQITRGTRQIAGPIPYPVMSIGNFDGVHMGHQIIFRRVAEIAHQNNGTGIVFTFEPHPLKILAPDKMPPLLTTFRKKMELIEQCGIDQVICADFNQQFADQQPRDFAKNILVDRIGVREIVVGYDYAFGRGREGTITYLKKMGEEFGFKVHVTDPVQIDGHRVSSSYVRELIEEGDVVRARQFLGRFYTIQGPVVHGYKTGRGIGFPTANIDTHTFQMPAIGVYAVLVRHGDRQYSGVVNIGFNPTFNRDRLSVEVHIFDFDESIYGAEIEIAFVERIRGEIQFASAEELVAQIEKDIATAKNILPGHTL
ncbi:MAG: bifunctional riboflavin kinase/FAD synthetase [Nitrospinaceae bacterium]|nr:bifunctional riboflavin kinase/FAD synthetase [Nitrospinaceae bacterium]NIR56117.1 bifunctional riboflavin kinase/FAD synthetase [Nitrospinaceae bacterium]NIS86565.1 bifunctional riboflavin kinase/FAD synthetase [Nitrospinaceae bacterium]NIT83399.1 bifunctional riboflavin kinase/FAD synthetase [Nitrospinaceae bacterium]NIU45609.1 bifunctional riboflavin kinase/FAD synthetase [Nitrospinaceae bacterium]